MTNENMHVNELQSVYVLESALKDITSECLTEQMTTTWQEFFPWREFISKPAEVFVKNKSIYHMNQY